MGIGLTHKQSNKKQASVRLNIRSRVLLPLLSLTFLAAAVMSAWPVGADPLPQFHMSASSGIPGTPVKINSIDPCPAKPADFDYQGVQYSFTDAAGHTTPQAGDSVNQDNSWGTVPWPIYIPWRTIEIYHNPITINAEAAQGTGTVQAKCVLTKTVGDPMDLSDDIHEDSLVYASQPFTVTGPSSEFSLSATTAETGTTLHVDSLDSCPGPEASVFINNSQGGRNKNATFNSSNNSWSVDIPLKSKDIMTQEETNLPAGDYLVSANCMALSGDQQFYGDQMIHITDSSVPYVALGDSFSSGEGLEPFEAGTGSFESGGNMCHRSLQAYPRLLAADPNLHLALGSNGFAACSGAITSSVTLGNTNEGAQMDKITANTKLITMTIGGNNMGFPDFAEDCFWNDCSGAGKTTALGKITSDVIPHMEYMLGTIRDRLINLGNSNAKVLIVGYPQVVTDTPWSNLEAVGCEWLDSNAEANATRDVINQLNSAIKNQVDAVGYNFHFVSATDSTSPFAGHELCRDSLTYGMPYFFNITPENTRYTFHPNTLGQQAYATLIKDYLDQHPIN